MPEYKVMQGDCISSIAADSGFLWSTLWNHPDNAQLKNQRKDPNALLQGDVVVIPDKTIKEESRADGAKYKFKKKGSPAKIKIRILEDDQPRKNTPYRLQVDGIWLPQGTTDGDGFVKAKIPANAQSGELRVGNGADQQIYFLALGTLDPFDTDSGAEDRLLGLGYALNPDDDDPLASALKAFQEKENLDVTGQLDDATKSKLQERYGQ